jgi:AcrR family transcriptional regulator
VTGKSSKTKRKRRSPGVTPLDASRATARSKEAAARRAAGRSKAASARREEVLDAARALIAEHGVAGASLRKLAHQLGISQPSLYHYFPSKEAMVSAIVERSAEQMLSSGSALPFPKHPQDLPRFCKDAVLSLWESDHHPGFVRFLFAIALESPENLAVIERVMRERLDPSFDALASALTNNEKERTDLANLARTIVYSIGFMLLEHRAILGNQQASPRILAFADWLAEAAGKLVSTPPSKRRRHGL